METENLKNSAIKMNFCRNKLTKTIMRCFLIFSILSYLTHRILMEYLRLITKEKEKMHVRWRPFHFSVLYIALNSSDILSYASHHWSPIFPQKNARIRRFTNNTPPIQFESIKKNVFNILSGVERTIIGELLWLYGEFFFYNFIKRKHWQKDIQS